MSDAPPPPLAASGRFEVGEVLGRALTVWMKNLLPFGLLSLIVHAPIILWLLVSLSGTLEVGSGYFYFAPLLTSALQLILTGAVIYGVVMQLQGKPVTLAKSVSVGLGRLFPVLGVGLLVVLCVFGGLLLFVIPGIIVALMLYVAVPVAVVERPGVMASLKRSSALTKGSKLQIFLLLVVVGVIGWLAGFILQQLFLASPTTDSIRTYLIISLLLQVFVTSPFGSVLNAVAYQTLRTTKEGASLDDLARVFD